MFIISQPVIETHDGKCRMTSTFSAPGLNKEIFFETEAQYGQYLTHEVADAFVVAALLPALVAGEDIEVSRVSSDLAYHFDTLTYLLGKVFDCKPIVLHAHEIVETGFAPQAVGSGFSGGVDSFCTYLRHTSEPCPDRMRITHLTLFNVGAYGNDYANTANAFQEDLKRAREFAEYVGKPLVPLDSNFSSIYRHEKIYYYSLRINLCLSSAVLALQKLFKIYYISSGRTIDVLGLSSKDQTRYEACLTQRLSNKNTSIFVAEHNLNRVRKTQDIAHNELARRFLYVCLADIFYDHDGIMFQKDNAPNCTECFKCLRTVSALDLLGALDGFSARFDLAKWARLRDDYFVEVYLNRNNDLFMGEIWDLFLETGHELSPAQWEKIRQAEMAASKASRRGVYVSLRILGGKVLRKLGLEK